MEDKEENSRRKEQIPNHIGFLPTEVAPSSIQTHLQLSSLTCSGKPVTVTAVLLGIEGPKSISTSMGESLLTILQLADMSLPNGLEFRIWGPRGVRLAATFRAFDVINISKARVRKEPRSPHTIFLQWDEGSDAHLVGDDPYANEIGKWRDIMFGKIVKMADKGKVRTREWQFGNVVNKKMRTTEMETHQLDVFVVGVFARMRRNSNGVRALCKLVCNRCSMVVMESTKGCEKCGKGAGCNWEYEDVMLKLKLRERKRYLFAKAKGDTVRKLVLGVEAAGVIENDSLGIEVRKSLHALANDQGKFVAVVEGCMESGHVNLIDLYIG